MERISTPRWAMRYVMAAALCGLAWPGTLLAQLSNFDERALSAAFTPGAIAKGAGKELPFEFYVVVDVAGGGIWSNHNTVPAFTPLPDERNLQRLSRGVTMASWLSSPESAKSRS
jgi:hypothetical protein